jgi:hypothetical protein
MFERERGISQKEGPRGEVGFVVGKSKQILKEPNPFNGTQRIEQFGKAPSRMPGLDGAWRDTALRGIPTLSVFMQLDEQDLGHQRIELETVWQLSQARPASVCLLKSAASQT